MSERKTKLEVEAFDMYERIRPFLEEYMDNWMLVGKRAGCGTRVMVGTSHEGWGDMRTIYESVQKWKKSGGEKPLENS